MILSIFCLDIHFNVKIETKHGPFAKTLLKWLLQALLLLLQPSIPNSVFRKASAVQSYWYISAFPPLGLLSWWKEATQNPRGEE